MRGRIIEVEETSCDSELRRRMKILGHLSLGTPVIFVEVALSGFLPTSATDAFRSELEARKRKRKKNVQREKRAAKRDSERENDMLGRSDSVFESMHMPSLSEQFQRQQLNIECKRGFTSDASEDPIECETTYNVNHKTSSAWAKVTKFGFAADINPDVMEGSSPPLRQDYACSPDANTILGATHNAMERARPRKAKGKSKEAVVFSTQQQRRYHD